jgi:hypothetical protein
VFARAIWSLLGRNSGKVDKKRQKFDYCSRLGGCARTQRSHDDRRNLDAPYLTYMINKQLPEDAVEAKRIT